MNCNNFENITQSLIIAYANNNLSSDYFNLKPIEVLKTIYTSGQTIILKGEKSVFQNLIHFWLITQTWYGSDGEDFLFKKLIIDDLKTYSKWQDEPYRVGICKIANKSENKKYNEIISKLLNTTNQFDYLIMNPSWNVQKVLFIDANNYYLYYFWTGE